MTTRILGLVALTLGFLVAGEVRAFQTNPTTTSGPGAMLITITGVEGRVQVRESSDKPWQTATVGMNVTEGAEFRTGPKSAVQVRIPPDQTITLDRLGTIKLMQAIQQGNLVKTKVGMPYGRTRYDIEEAGIEHQSELVSPSSTLAIRGTKVSIYDQPPFAPSAVSLTGRAEFRTAKRQVAFGGKGQGKTDVSSDADNPAQLALLQTYVDPNSKFGRPEADQKLINQLQSKGDIVLNNGTVALAFGPAVSDKRLADIVAGQGRFNISLRWFGPGDFDLFVLTNDQKTGAPYTLGNPNYNGSIFKDTGFIFAGNGLNPITQDRTPDGGRIKFDQVAFGGGGFELASWNTPVPQIGYTVAIVYYDQSGKIKNYPVRQKFRLDAFLDGKSVPVLTNFDEIVQGKADSLVFGPTYEGFGSLIPSEQILPTVPEANFKGDIQLSAVDLSIEAVGPINGKANGQGGTVTPAAKRATVTRQPKRATVVAPASTSKIPVNKKPAKSGKGR